MESSGFSAAPTAASMKHDRFFEMFHLTKLSHFHSRRPLRISDGLSRPPDDMPFSDMPGSVAIRIEPVEPHLFNRFRGNRRLIAKLSLRGTSTTIAVVMRKRPRNGGYYENRTPQHGCDLAVGIDEQAWKRPHPQADKAGEMAIVLRQTHWVRAGEPCRIEWRRYEGDYIQYDHDEALHPNELNKESGWVLTRNVNLTTIRHPMTKPFDQKQKTSIDAPWAGEVVYPYYLMLETCDGNGNALFQGMERRVTFGRRHTEARWGERCIQWEGHQRGTFPEAVRDLFKHHANLNCSPIYTRSDQPAFNALRNGEMRDGRCRTLFQHFTLAQPLTLANAVNQRTTCGRMAYGLFSCDTPEKMVEYADGYQRKESADTLSRHDRMPCRTCYSKVQVLVQAQIPAIGLESTPLVRPHSR